MKNKISIGMKKILGFSFSFLFVLLTLSFAQSASAVDLSACGTISTPGTYTLTQNIGSGGTCITVGVDGVIIDGASLYTIDGSVVGADGITDENDQGTLGISITLQNITVTGSVTSGNGGTYQIGFGNGGNGGSMTITNATVGNINTGNGGRGDGTGGNSGSITISNSTTGDITSGAPGDASGGMTVGSNGSITISDSTTGDIVAGNGISNGTNGSSSGSVEVLNSITGDITASNGGTGEWNGGGNGGSVTITNSTAGNITSGTSGSSSVYIYNGGNITIINSTFGNLHAGNGGNPNGNPTMESYGGIISISNTDIDLSGKTITGGSGFNFEGSIRSGVINLTYSGILTKNTSTIINNASNIILNTNTGLGPWNGVFDPNLGTTISNIDQCNNLVLGSIYTLTNDITGDCLITRSGMTIDGGGYTFTGDITSSSGISDHYSDNGTDAVNITLQNITVVGNVTSGNGGDGTCNNWCSFLGGQGGAITISDSTIVGNVISGNGGSGDNGPGIGGSITISNGIVSNIKAGNGESSGYFGVYGSNAGLIDISGTNIDISNTIINGGLGGGDSCNDGTCIGMNSIVNFNYSNLITNPSTYIYNASDVIINNSSLGTWNGLFNEYPLTDTTAVSIDKDSLTNNLIKNQNADISHIVTPLSTLPLSGDLGSTISWLSSDPSVLSNDGQTVNRPSFENGNTSITLTATITKGSVIDTKVFNLIIIKSPATTSTNTGPTSEKFLSDITDGLITVDGGNPLSTPKVTLGVPYTIQAGDIEVIFPTGTEITKEGGGNIDFTEFTTIDTTSLTRESLTGTLGSIKIGIPNLGLLFSTPITLSIPVDPKYNGQTVDVYYQSEGSTRWNTETTCTIVNALCTFTTNHATTFAVKKDVATHSSGSSASSRYSNLLAMGKTEEASQLQQQFPNQINQVVVDQSTVPNKITKTLKQGLKNDSDVKILQSYLNQNLKLTLTVDGSFGPKTKQAVISFQKLSRLTPDGIVGKMTLGMMK